MITNTTTFKCDNCGVEQYVERIVHEIGDTILIVSQPDWRFVSDPNGGDDIALCPGCSVLKIEFTYRLIDPRGTG